MDSETSGAEALAGGEVVAPPTVETSDQTTEQATTETVETDQAEPDTGDDTPAKPKKKHWAQERIDELTRQKHEAARQAEFWKARASQTVDVADLEYEDQIAERTIQRTRQEQVETAEATVRQYANETFAYRETIAREAYPDYDAVTRSPNVRITDDMAKVIFDSDVGPQIAYHLGKNPAEAAQIAALPPHLQAAELGALKAKITAPKALPKQPPAPVQPVGGNVSGGVADPGKMSMAEYVAARNAGKI